MMISFQGDECKFFFTTEDTESTEDSNRKPQRHRGTEKTGDKERETERKRRKNARNKRTGKQRGLQIVFTTEDTERTE
jgi:hypothetical protein